MARKMELKASPFIFTGLKRHDIITKFLNILNSKFQVSTFLDKLGPRITVWLLLASSLLHVLRWS